MSFSERLIAIDDGRFEKLIEAMDGTSDYCERCRFWTGNEADGQARCACIGSCPGVTLSERLKDYLKEKLK